MAIEHKNITSSENHEPKSIDLATAGQVYTSDGLGSGLWKDVEKSFFNIVEVTGLSDFPTPVNGVISLEENIGYYISGSVDITPNRVLVDKEGTAILGFNRASDVLITDVANPLITSINKNVLLSGFSVKNTNIFGTLFDLDNSGTNVCILDKLIFGDCQKVGVIGSFQNIIIDNCGINSATDIGGITFTGQDTVEISVRDSFFKGWSGSFIDLSLCKADLIEFSGTRFLGKPEDVAIEGEIDSGNINLNGMGLIGTCVFIGMDGATKNINHYDENWVFSQALGIQDTHYIGEINMTNNSIQTPITTLGEWVKVEGTTLLSTVSENFTQNDNNEIESKLRFPRHVLITLNISAQKSGGGTDNLRFAVFKDDGAGFNIVNPNAISSTEAEAKKQSVSLTLTDVAKLGDKYSLYVQNTTSIDNAEVVDLQFVIKG
jgi:hypothetical protein